MKVKLFNLIWDTDEEVVDLPDEVVIDLGEVEDDTDLHEMAMDIASEDFGWCINSCEFEIIRQ